jgi:hypothetical protein
MCQNQPLANSLRITACPALRPPSRRVWPKNPVLAPPAAQGHQVLDDAFWDEMLALCMNGHMKRESFLKMINAKDFLAQAGERVAQAGERAAQARERAAMLQVRGFLASHGSHPWVYALLQRACTCTVADAQHHGHAHAGGSRCSYDSVGEPDRQVSEADRRSAHARARR